MPPLLILMLESGCVTHALWTNGNLEAYKEPAQNPNLHLFQSKQCNDFLVLYDEYSERNGAIHTRVYWLNKNQNRVKEQRAPVFVREKSVDNWSSIPVYYSMPEKVDLDKSFYAVCDTNQQSFVLYSGNRKVGAYDFPVYNDHWGLFEKTALTPFAVSTDVATVAGYAAVYYIYAVAQSGYTFSIK